MAECIQPPGRRTHKLKKKKNYKRYASGLITMHMTNILLFEVRSQPGKFSSSAYYSFIVDLPAGPVFQNIYISQPHVSIKASATHHPSYIMRPNIVSAQVAHKVQIGALVQLKNFYPTICTQVNLQQSADLASAIQLSTAFFPFKTHSIQLIHQ